MLDKFSEDLKKTRESKNISLIEVADRTKLHIAFLENLEKADFDFQPQAYIRAFLKQYAKAIGIDPENILKDYDLAKSGKYVSSFPLDKSDETVIVPSIPEPEKKSYFEKPGKEETGSKQGLEDQEITGRPSFHVDNDETKFRREHFVSADAPTRSTEKKSIFQKSGAGKNQIDDKPPKSRSHQKITFNTPLVRNILLVIFILILVLGVYSFVNILLKESSDEPEVRRQNFEDIVREQEQRILGKKSEEEIQDSIRKAEEDRVREQEQLDSITLKVISIAPGSMAVAADSSGMKKPGKVTYGNNEIGIFKAKHFFMFTNDNTSSVKVTLNDKPIEFETKKVDKVRITRDGVIR
jgi:transcriptional regulator with XRE-family HTH domain